MRCVSPWYNCTGWLGVKHQLTYLLIGFFYLALGGAGTSCKWLVVCECISRRLSSWIVSLAYHMCVRKLAPGDPWLYNRSKMGQWGISSFGLASGDFFFFFLSCLVRSLLASGIDWLIDDHLYSTILHSLEQTHCARMWFYMSDWLFFL